MSEDLKAIVLDGFGELKIVNDEGINDLGLIHGSDNVLHTQLTAERAVLLTKNMYYHTGNRINEFTMVDYNINI